jgi:hypothetical protein
MAFRLMALALATGMAATACATQAGETDDASALEEALAQFERSGETISCLPTHRIDNIDPIDEQNWLVTTRAGETYLNTVSRGCFNADRPFTYLSYSVPGGQLCRGEIVRVIDSSSRMARGSCGLGDYEELIPIE